MQLLKVILVWGLICSSARGDIEKRALIFPPTSLYGVLPMMGHDHSIQESVLPQWNHSFKLKSYWTCDNTFLAIAVPIDIPDKNVFVSYNFESNYSVVTNITEIDEVLFPNLPVISSRHSRSITRELAYTVLEARFKEHGMKGKECMLRNICEAAETPLHHNGLLGHIMHIIFTPSTSREEGLSDDYYQAELDGQNGDCDKYLDLCPFSIFDLVTRLVEYQN